MKRILTFMHSHDSIYVSGLGSVRVRVQVDYTPCKLE